MKKPRPLDDLEMHELLRLLYPDHIRSDDDAYFELSQQACESTVDLGDGFEVPLPELLARVQELEGMLEAVGAGGVSAQRVTQAKWTGALRGEDCKYEVFDDRVKTMIPRNPVFVRITHIPTGVTVECRDDERSSYRNSGNAWLMLEAELKEAKKADEFRDCQTPLSETPKPKAVGIFKNGTTLADIADHFKWAADPAAMLRIKATQEAVTMPEREAFEKWAASHFSGINLARDGDDYSFALAKDWWPVWQARAALDADHIAQDRKMVAAPVALPEPVAAQIRHIKEERWRTIAIVLYDLFAGDEYERRYIYTEQQVRDLLAEAACTKSQTTAQEPFGYFKAEPFGWRDCAETDEGAIALYEAPQPQADTRDAECFRFWESSWTMAVAAVRYCLGRGTHIVSDCQEWLCDIWDELPEKAQTIIRRDVEEAFKRDDEDRAAGKDYRALGDACDMLCWEKVRKLWRNEGASTCEKA